MTFLITAQTHTITQTKFIPFLLFPSHFRGKSSFLSYPREANWLDDDDASCFIVFLSWSSWFGCLPPGVERSQCFEKECWRFG